MNWLLIAEIFSALDEMVRKHDWDMTCGENGWLGWLPKRIVE